MPQMGKLELIIGPMFSGKSTELIRHIRMMKVINAKYIVIKPKIDNRYESDKIVSHNKDSESCIVVDDLNEVTDEMIIDCIYLIIDEGQFLKNLKNKVLYWVEKLNKNVIIGGLDGDFQRNPIGEIIALIPYADICNKKTALCKICNDGTNALFSHRICGENKSDNKDQILIGSNDSYIPLCRKHYLTVNNLS
jgi:thymidine kinase